jgi:hypothetical protein
MTKLFSAAAAAALNAPSTPNHGLYSYSTEVVFLMKHNAAKAPVIRGSSLSVASGLTDASPVAAYLKTLEGNFDSASVVSGPPGITGLTKFPSKMSPTPSTPLPSPTCPPTRPLTLVAPQTKLPIPPERTQEEPLQSALSLKESSPRHSPKRKPNDKRNHQNSTCVSPNASLTLPPFLRKSPPCPRQ